MTPEEAHQKILEALDEADKEEANMKISKSKVASFDVDAQNSFTPLCPDELPVVDGDKIVDELNEQAEYASIRVGSKDAHPPNAIWLAADMMFPQFSAIEGDNVDVRWNRHCIVGTYGFQLLDRLPHPIDYDYFVWKGIEPDVHPYGACYHDLRGTKSTGVIEFLKSKGIRMVIVGGLATDYCVKTTALQLKKAGFDVKVNLLACRGVAQETTNKAIEEMKEAGIEIITEANEFANCIEV